jgi:ribosomal protein S18 acetylase RimI-like enzyme
MRLEARLMFKAFREQDAPELTHMVLRLYQEDPSTQAMTKEKILRTIRELENRPDKGQITLFWIGESIAGYAIVIHHWSNEHNGNIEFVDELYVKPAWRGQGVGSAFLDHLSDVENRPTCGLQLEVTPAIERAFQFYLRRGFKQCANRFMLKKFAADVAPEPPSA